MAVSCDIVLIDSTDGFTPRQMQKLNYNFSKLLKSGLTSTERSSQMYSSGASSDEAYARQEADRQLNDKIDSVEARITDLVKDKMHPVGSTYITFGTENPNTMLMADGETRVFAGTWQKVAQGKMLIGAGTDGDGDTFTVGTDGGEKKVTLTEGQIPKHNHEKATLTGSFSISDNVTRNQTISAFSAATGIAKRGTNHHTVAVSSGTTGTAGLLDRIDLDATHTHSDVGNNEAHNNMPPYTPVNIWKRTA